MQSSPKSIVRMHLMRQRTYVLNAGPMQWFVRPLLDLGSGVSGLDVAMYKLSPPCMTKFAFVSAQACYPSNRSLNS